MHSRQNPSHVGRFVPGMEALEDRTVPAGNVQVMVGDGVLYVGGDDAGNQIWVAGAGSNNVVIRSLDGATTINGQLAPLFVKGVKHGYHIDLAGGDNVLMVTGTQNDTLTVKTGDGNDVINIGGAGHRRETLVLTGGGNDQLILNGQFRSAVLVNTGAGDDLVTANQVRVTDLYMMNPAGNDLFNNQGSAIGRPNFTGFTPGSQPPAPPTLPPAPPPPPPPPPAPDTQAPAVAFALLSDTGSSNTDKLTNDQRINLTVTDASPIARLNAGFDSTATGGYINILPNLNSNGTVNLTAALVAAINKNTKLTEGSHTLFIDVADSAGNSTLQQFTFTIDKTGAPISFDLDPSTDTGTAGDLITGSTTATLTGTTQGGVTVQILEFMESTGAEVLRATTTASAGGTFRVEGVPLHAGSNIIRVRSVDAAGNVITVQKTITRTTGPTVTAGANLNRSVQAAATTNVDLKAIFDTLVRFETSDGNINMTLFEESAPLTVANFLKYVNGTTTNGGNYNNSIFHRLDKDFVLQGGGFRFEGNSFPAIAKDAPVNNEFGTLNTRGTIAMAKQPGNVNSATNEFFFNLADNTDLNTQNGGFTVFGKVSDAGLATLDRIQSRFTEFSDPGIPGSPPFPVRNGANTASFPTKLDSKDVAQLFRAMTLSDPLTFTFTATSTNPSVATVSVTGTTMAVTGVAAGTTTITLTATDTQGQSKQVTFNITVT